MPTLKVAVSVNLYDEMMAIMMYICKIKYEMLA
jgi:hypothetical protein